MIEFGKSLKAARETKGLTVSQLAEATHILTQIVEGLENEDFTKIVAPIYGRGFVKLYCEAVGLEPKPFIEQFMFLYNGTVPKAETPAPAATPAPDTANTESAPTEGIQFPLPLNARMLTVAVSAIIVLLLVAFGLRALYRATTADSATVTAVPEQATEKVTEETAEPLATPTAGAPRQPLPVKPFYAD